jgi:hypothetical protein
MTSLPIFFTYRDGIISLNPKDSSLIGTHSVIVTVSDTFDDASYTFSVNVKKELPKFLSELED